MGDDLTKKGPADRTRVNIHEDWEVSYWCKEFACTKEQLVACVKSAGVMVSDVRRCLGK